MRGNAADAARGGTRSQSRPPRLRALRPRSVASPPWLGLACSRPPSCARVGLACVASPPSSVLASSPRAPRAPCLRAASLCASARAPALRGAAGAAASVGRVRSLPRPCVLGRRPLRARRPRLRRVRSFSRPRVLGLAAVRGGARLGAGGADGVHGTRRRPRPRDGTARLRTHRGRGRGTGRPDARRETRRGRRTRRRPRGEYAHSPPVRRLSAACPLRGAAAGRRGCGF